MDGSFRGVGGGYPAWTVRALLVQTSGVPTMTPRPLPLILALGTTQTLAWASSMYLPAILADPIARDLGVPSTCGFAASSSSRVPPALVGPRLRRQIGPAGARPRLSTSHPVRATGRAVPGLAP